jgi:hypothetical protein
MANSEINRVPRNNQGQLLKGGYCYRFQRADLNPIGMLIEQPEAIDFFPAYFSTNLSSFENHF